MQSIAQSEHMTFIDNSAATQKDLESVDHTLEKLHQTSPVINIGVEREDRTGLGAGNLGLSTYEVAVGFSEGSNPSEAHRFADMVVKRLGELWHVETVPAGTGARPMKTCAPATTQTSPPTATTAVR